MPIIDDSDYGRIGLEYRTDCLLQEILSYYFSTGQPVQFSQIGPQ